MLYLPPLLRLDFEARSEAELGGKNSVGLYNYAIHSSTLVLMLGYKYPEEKDVRIWFPHLEPMPGELLARLNDQSQMLSAFNSSYERYMLQYKLGITIPAERFLDPQVGARYLSMPGDLEEVGKILGLPPELAKDKRGKELIELFSKPKKRSLGRGKGHVLYFNDWNSHPKEFEEFGEYCKQDVRAEEEVSRRENILQAFPLPNSEHQIWLFDQRVNDRGMPVDVEFVEKAYKLALRAKKEALDRQNKMTGLENANSRTQLLPWLRARGYPFNTLRKDTVTVVLKNPDVQLAPEARDVLTARREAASTSYQKLAAILRQVGPDGFLRNQFIFMGSSRCGRWSGNAVQLHNMARPDELFEDLETVRKARKMIYEEDFDGLSTSFIDPKSKKAIPALLVIKNVIRTVFSANPVPKVVAVSDDDDDE